MTRHYARQLLALGAGIAIASGSLALPATTAMGEEQQARGWSRSDEIPVRGILGIDATNAGDLLAVGQVGPSFDHPHPTVGLARRTPSGAWTHVHGLQIGEVKGYDITRSGVVTVVSVRGKHALATRWAPGTKKVTTRRILAEAAGEVYVDFNPAGDLLAWSRHTGGKSVDVARRVDEVWSRVITVRPGRYSGALRSLAITHTGAAVGAFTSDDVLVVRHLGRASREFGPAHTVMQFPRAVADSTDEDEVTITTGSEGDSAVVWGAIREAPPSVITTSKIAVLPAQGHRWQHTFEPTTDSVASAVVAANGNTFIELGVSTYRWSADRRELSPPRDGDIRAANDRGDIVLAYSFLTPWPFDGPRAETFRKPVGYLRQLELTSHRLYAVVSRDGQPRALLFSRLV